MEGNVHRSEKWKGGEFTETPDFAEGPREYWIECWGAHTCEDTAWEWEKGRMKGSNEIEAALTQDQTPGQFSWQIMEQWHSRQKDYTLVAVDTRLNAALGLPEKS